MEIPPPERRLQNRRGLPWLGFRFTRRRSGSTLASRATRFPAHLFHMRTQMTPGGLSVGGIAPLDLIESRERIAQVRDVEAAVHVVMGEMPQRLSVGHRLDRREGGIRKLPDVLAAPRRGMSGRSSQDQEANQHSKDPSRSHDSSPLLAASQLSPCLKATRPPRDSLTPLAFSARVPLPQSVPPSAASPAWEATMPFISL